MYSTIITFFVLAITISFLCSLWEAVLLSITQTYAQIKFHEKKFIGRQLLHFKDNIDKPLAAILILNTFAHTIGAIGVGEQASIIWADTNPIITKFWVPVIMTLAILILSEIIPKTIGANFWERLVYFTVYSLTILLKILLPLVWACQLITKIFRKKETKSIFSRYDFLTLTEIGEKQGIFQESEADLIEKTLDLHELNVADVMRPVKDMVMFNSKESYDSLLLFIKQHKFTRYPIYDEKKDKVIGLIHSKDLLTHDHNKKIKPLIRPILKIVQNLPLKSLLNKFKSGMPHFALVYDGEEIVGFITLDDILQVLLGIIKDEFNFSHADWHINKDNSITANGRCSIASLEKVLNTQLKVEDDNGIKTIAGLVLYKLGSLPKKGQRIEFDSFYVIIDEVSDFQILELTIYLYS